MQAKIVMIRLPKINSKGKSILFIPHDEIKTQILLMWFVIYFDDSYRKDMKYYMGGIWKCEILFFLTPMLYLCLDSHVAHPSSLSLELSRIDPSSLFPPPRLHLSRDKLPSGDVG